MDGTYLIIDELISSTDIAPTLIMQSDVNLTNLHTSVYGLFLVHASDDTLTSGERHAFGKASLILNDITPDTLYDLMEGDASTYGYDSKSMLAYANNVIHYNSHEDKM